MKSGGAAAVRNGQLNGGGAATARIGQYKEWGRCQNERWAGDPGSKKFMALPVSIKSGALPQR